MTVQTQLHASAVEAECEKWRIERMRPLLLTLLFLLEAIQSFEISDVARVADVMSCCVLSWLKVGMP